MITTQSLKVNQTNKYSCVIILEDTFRRNSRNLITKQNHWEKKGASNGQL